jgi:hypothetical protein
MFSLEVFVFESPDGADEEFTTLDAEEARRHAQQHGLRCVAMLFEYAETALFCDFTAQQPKRRTKRCRS